MIKTYLKLAYRSLVKNRVFSFINIIGLAMGLACCLLISMYVYQEFTYDRHHALKDRLYQLGTRSENDGKEKRSANTPAPMAPVMQQEFPEITAVTRLLKAFQDDKTLLQTGNKEGIRSFYETGGYLADSNFFQLFSYDFVEGNAASALADPNSLVLSEEIAKKIFGKNRAVGEVLHVNSNTNGVHDFTVTGVYRPAATPSHIDARFFMSMQGGDVGPWVRQITNMTNNNLFYSYLLLQPGTNAKALEAKFDAFIKKHAGEDLKNSGRTRSQFLIPLPDIHLYSGTEANVTPGGSLSYLYILVSIALVTLLIACVNFMNLSTARSSKRAVEIGVRKVMGAQRYSLVRQFLWEAVLLAFFSFLISIVLCFVFRSLFEQLSGRELNFPVQQYLFFFSGFLFVSILAGLVAGIYPAFYLSAFRPVKVLKGKFSNSLAALSFRKVLVVFQFVISVALIVASVTIKNQMNFLRNKDLGFQKDQQVVIPLRTNTSKEIYPALKNALLAQPSISHAGGSLYYPGITNVSDWLLYRQGTPPDQTRTVFMNRVDDAYLTTLGIRPVAGRLFSPDFPADTNNRIILNEQATREFGFSSAGEAIGKNIAASRGDQEVLFQIIGVVKDFHFKDLHAPIESYGFLLNRAPIYNYLIAHVRATDLHGAIAAMSGAWNQLNPNEPFEYSFLDQDFEKNYRAEDRLAGMIRSFTFLAILISCLGLFGLTTFSVEQRTKEIGIRKVLGASAAGIVSLLSKDFLKLVVLSFVIASPLAWYFIQNWLQGFAYRAPFTIWMIVASWLLALLIAFLTISIQALRVALSNPVENLRTE